MLDRFDVLGVKCDRLPCQLDAPGDVVCGMAGLRLGEERARVCLRVAQRMPSMSFNASRSVNTRNELVRTLPWLLTASETRVIVSSSGASAMTT